MHPIRTEVAAYDSYSSLRPRRAFVTTTSLILLLNVVITGKHSIYPLIRFIGSK